MIELSVLSKAGKQTIIDIHLADLESQVYTLFQQPDTKSVRIGKKTYFSFEEWEQDWREG